MLSTRNVTLPSDRVGMVIAQPHLSLTDTEPYRCIPAARGQQLAMLTETLAVAKSNRHGAPKTHFTVFPEYSIPGLDGITTIETVLHSVDWPNGTIIIGGTDACPNHKIQGSCYKSDTHCPNHQLNLYGDSRPE